MSETVLPADDMESDVVVVGYGGAGACAAITAHDGGAKVVILEKMPRPGGNTRVSNCSWFCPAPGTEQQAIEHIDTLCFDRTERAVIEAYVAAAGKNKEWLESLGATRRLTTGCGGHPLWSAGGNEHQAADKTQQCPTRTHRSTSARFLMLQ